LVGGYASKRRFTTSCHSGFDILVLPGSNLSLKRRTRNAARDARGLRGAHLRGMALRRAARASPFALLPDFEQALCWPPQPYRLPFRAPTSHFI